MHGLLWVIFALVYLGMALGRLPGVALDRTGVALLGAIAMIAVRGIGLTDAARAVDFQTILLLFSLMLFSAQLADARFYQVVGRALTRGMARPKRLLAAMIFVSAVLSALLANDIVCLAFTPVLCGAFLGAKRDPMPYLVALATSCNIGSAATIIGNPQNMYIGVAGQLSFARFTLVMLPIVLVALGFCWATVIAVWPAAFVDGIHADVPEPAVKVEHESSFECVVVFKTLVILAALVVAFVVLPAIDRVVAALAGGGLLMISRRRDSARLYQQVDWDLLLLFFGLFVVNGAMKQSGLTAEMMRGVASTGIDLHSLPTLAGVTTVLSNIVSNVPAVLLLRPSIPQHSVSAWYLLAMASTWAGNLTLVGSIANLIVAEQAARLGVKLDLKSYCKVGIPLTIVTVAMGTVWLVWLFGVNSNSAISPTTQPADQIQMENATTN
jgi:Na+/H+ antiporter NhaD/arsenite permease-like protein